MSTGLSVPEVSLITSWRVAEQPYNAQDAAPYGMYQALKEGIGLLDLYFLDHRDIAWYEAHAKRHKPVDAETLSEPHKFAASLQSEHLQRIADDLQKGLVESYSGKLVGRRPRFAALATYFPDISLPLGAEDPEGKSRNTAVKALRNTLYLAHRLGCHCVEIVGGAGVPGPDYIQEHNPEEYRQLRREMLAQSLNEVYDTRDGNNPLKEIVEDRNTIPVVAVELEPSASHLMNHLEEFQKLQDVLRGEGTPSLAWKSLRLNVDVAHAFLIGYTPDDLKSDSLKDVVAHMHLSDHAGHLGRGGAHASDLPPGIFHNYADYKPWLQYAIELTRRSKQFSGAIAIEMEACYEQDVMLAAVNTTRRWLQTVSQDTEQRNTLSQTLSNADMKEGALVVVDVGNSTEVFFQGNPLDGCLQLTNAIEKLCTDVHSETGSIMSFTGDGFIALFEAAHFPDAQSALLKALHVAERVSIEVSSNPYHSGLTGRAAVHWGEAYIPASGRLRDQVIGLDVVFAARVCQWLSIVEKGQSSDAKGSLIAISDTVYEKLPASYRAGWNHYRKETIKGVSGEFTFHIRSTPAHSPDR